MSRSPLDEIRALGAERPVVILDDDATGSQAVRDVEALLRFDGDRIAVALRSNPAGLFVVTNSRSLGEDAAVDLAHRLGDSIARIARRARRPVSVISRSDSTLRGHFPAEVDALAAGLGMVRPRILLAPYFGEAGRVTIDDVHSIERGGRRVPVGETEFASEPRFGYRSSNLLDWVREKAPGRPVASVGLDAVRMAGPAAVADALTASPPGGVVVVNAAEQRDIEVAAAGALRAERDGLPVIARTAASFARARLGQRAWPPLATLPARRPGPGLVVVGSHVPMSTTQLARLVAAPPSPIEPILVEVLDVLGSNRDTVIAAAAATADAASRAGRTPVIATARDVHRGQDRDADLRIEQGVSGALVAIVRLLGEPPAWVVAKGGITSTDIAGKAFEASGATVVGQVETGVSLWTLGRDARLPGLPYVVFPGNVGDSDTLRAVVARLRAGP